MSTIEIIAFGSLWLTLLALALLLLLLYRQVERAYQRASREQASGLAPGVEVPELEILTATGIETFSLPVRRRPHAAGLRRERLRCM